MSGQKITLVLQHLIVRLRVRVETQTDRLFVRESGWRRELIMQSRRPCSTRKDVMMGQKITLAPMHPVRESWWRRVLVSCASASADTR